MTSGPAAPAPSARRRRAGVAALLALAAVTTTSCWERAIGTPPGADSINFPLGLLLDPRPRVDLPEDGQRARWLFVSNGNSDLSSNAASVIAIDLDGFFAAWEASPGSAIARSDMPDVGAEVSDDAPCRRYKSRPQVIECTEEPFVAEDASVFMTSFTTVLRADDPNPDDDKIRLLTPVRGDPSVTFMDVSGGLGDGALRIECGQGQDPDLNPRRCDDDHRLRFLYNDEEESRISPEPANMVIDGDLAVLVHYRSTTVTVFDLVGVDGRPQAVDAAALLDDFVTGAYGIAVRPCAPGNAASLSTTVVDQCLAAPASCVEDVDCGHEAFECRASACEPRLAYRCVGDLDCGADAACVGLPVECQRPMVYTAGRQSRFVVTFTVDQVEDGGYPQLIANSFFVPGIFDIGDVVGPVFGEMAFADQGDTLYIVQSNPGGLVRVDTSLDDNNDPKNLPAGVLEICDEPNAMILYGDDAGEFVAMTCHRPALVFIVDLVSFQVIANVLAGTAPHELVHDPARGFLYVANSLDQTISVIDVARDRPTRFTEVARIGLEEPYSR
ncbi:MAG: hypothetical protein KC636_17075 [Myxococcales bacterium]|nr:hypothetical protein [Myxococcales bacterium]